MPFPRRRPNPGAWHHNTATLITGALAAGVVTQVGIDGPASPPTTIRAASLDIQAIDPSNFLILTWGTYVLPAGIAAVADPTVTDSLESLYWLYGQEPCVPQQPMCVHANPKTARRLQQGDKLMLFVKTQQATSAGFFCMYRYDRHYKVM
jgi:hypothetical protein